MAGTCNPETLASVRFLSFRPGPACAGRPEGEIPLEFLKGGHRRATYRARLGDQRAIIKISFHPLGRFKLARERRRILALGRRGLPVPRIAGEGWTSAGGFALVFEELAGFVSFADAWLAAPDGRARGDLLLQLAGSLRDLHARGVEHRDPHPQNLFLGPGGAVWLDAAAIRLRPGGRPLSAGRAIRNLALVHCAFGGARQAGGREWLRGLRAYLAETGRSRRHDWARKVLRLSARLRKRLLRRRLRRCLRTNREFVQVRLPGRRAAVRISARGPSWTRFLESPESFFEGAEILKDGRSTRAARVRWDGRTAFLKRYHRPGALHCLKYLLRRSRAFRGWAAGHALELGSIPAPRPIAVLDLRRRGLPFRSYLVTEWAEGETSDRALRELAPGESGEAPVRTLTAALARLHALGIRHRDLKPQNVFFGGPAAGISLVDFDGLRFPMRLSAPRRLKDLERWLRDLSSPDLAALARQSYQHDYTLAELGFPREFPTRPCLPGRFAYNTKT